VHLNGRYIWWWEAIFNSTHNLPSMVQIFDLLSIEMEWCTVTITLLSSSLIWTDIWWPWSYCSILDLWLGLYIATTLSVHLSRAPYKVTSEQRYLLLSSHSVGRFGYILPPEHCDYKVPIEYVLCGPLRLLSLMFRLTLFWSISKQSVCLPMQTFLTSQYFRLK